MRIPTTPRPTLLLAVLLLLAATACAASDEAGTAEPADGTAAPSETPTSAPVDREDLATPTADGLSLPATGTLGVDEVEGGCTYLDVDGQRYEVVAAPGSGLVVDPANGVIADSGGEVLARAGETVTLDGVVDEGLVTFCQLGPVLAVESVQPA